MIWLIGNGSHGDLLARGDVGTYERYGGLWEILYDSYGRYCVLWEMLHDGLWEILCLMGDTV